MTRLWKVYFSIFFGTFSKQRPGVAQTSQCEQLSSSISRAQGWNYHSAEPRRSQSTKTVGRRQLPAKHRSVYSPSSGAADNIDTPRDIWGNTYIAWTAHGERLQGVDSAFTHSTLLRLDSMYSNTPASLFILLSPQLL